LAWIIDRVCDEHAPTYLARRVCRVAAVIDGDDFDEIVEPVGHMAGIPAADASLVRSNLTGPHPGPSRVGGRCEIDQAR
jgi:hypothetical protein